MATQMEVFTALVVELRSLAGARSNAGAAMNAFAGSMAGKLIADAAMAGPFAREMAKQAKWAAKDYASDQPNLGPIMGKIEAMLASMGGAVPEATTPPVPQTPPSGGAAATDVDTLAQLVMKLSQRSDEQGELLAAMKAKLDTL
jgi:membrane protease subunit (stomatin/prohibitin family)